jgi:hypothetical protein
MKNTSASLLSAKVCIGGIIMTEEDKDQQIKPLAREDLKDPDPETLKRAKKAILDFIENDEPSDFFKMMGTTEEEVDEFHKELERIKKEEWSK